MSSYADAVTAYTESHSRGDVDAVVALFADDAVVYDPVDQPPYEGIEAVRGFFGGTHEMVDSLTLTLTGPIRTTKHEAAFPMMATSVIGDLKMEIDIIDVMTFNEDGKITQMRAYWNMSDARTLA